MKPTLSYSEYSMALDCLRRYKYVCIDKIKTDALESGDMAFGTSLHAGINTYLEGDDGADIFKVYWESYRGKEMQYSRFGWDELDHIGSEFLRKFEKKYLRDLKPFKMEERLYGEFQGIKFEGTPDFIGTYQGTPVVLDWKTSGYRYKAEKIRSSLQLYLYSYLAKTVLGFDSKQIGYLVFVKDKAMIQSPILLDITSEQVHSVLSEMADYYKKLSLEESYPRNLNACIKGSYLCPFFKTCVGETK